MAHKRPQPDPKAINELVNPYVAMKKTENEKEFQPLLNRHDEITKKLGFPQILFRSLDDMKTGTTSLLLQLRLTEV